MEEKTKTANKFVFALPRAGSSIVMNMANFALLFLYVDAYQLNGLLCGLALMCGKFSIAFFQFFFG